ncbi:glycosyltransferase, partial [Paraclostridium bifermentans]|uniref:glycosyltransferase n=1 Tax=Paraclostridium bifermentans TaxID=1490 RepID=UPI00242E07FE
MLLSIVMMIKNEEKYLDNTLKSLNPLMNNIKSELIILDTGSTDRSIEIAQKYTKKVYFEKWNDNFAQMRNISVGYAKGEWILIVDADEELVNYEKLINFFKNGVHKKYSSASIELTNIMSEDRTLFNKASIVRLFKKDRDFRYEGAIHEQPIYKEPIFNDIANFNHYGYMYKNEEVKQKKLNRNEKILLSELKLNPNNPYILYQLAMNYSAFGEKKEALSYMEKCYEIYNKLGNTYSYVTSGLAKLYIELDEYEKCEKLCKDYIKNDNKNIDIYCYIAISQNNLKKYKESLDNYNRYLHLLENYEISTQANDLYSVCDTISFIENVKIDMINIYYNLGMYEKVEIESKKINFNQISKIYN